MTQPTQAKIRSHCSRAVRSTSLAAVLLVIGLLLPSSATIGAPVRSGAKARRPVGSPLRATPKRLPASPVAGRQTPNAERRAPNAALPALRASTQRYAIYMLGSRVGTSVVTQAPTQFEGRDALRVDAKTEMKIVAFVTIEQHIDLTQYLDREGRPLTLAMSMSSGGRTTKVDARFTASQVACVVESGGTKTEKKVEIPQGVSLIADPDQLGLKSPTGKLKPGTKLKLHMFEPMTLQILPIEIEVVGPESITVGGKSYAATLMKSMTPLTGESKSWLDESGELLQQESVLGLKMVRESVDTPAPSMTTYTPPPDFAIATSVRTKTVIKDPRKVGVLRLRVHGIPDESLVLTDARQAAEVTREEGKLVVTYTIRAAREAALGGGPLATGRAAAPTPNTQHPTPHSEYLAAVPYLEVDDPRIQRQAKEIVGTVTDPLEKAQRIRSWVFLRMKPQMDIGVIRSAVDVYQKPAGVCRDYATLFTALARAAGVPARVCGGIIYFNGGFFYHAWSEVQTAPGAEWVAFDPTLPTNFVDATHIKFGQGDPTAMFQAIRVVGQLKAEVLEYR